MTANLYFDYCATTPLHPDVFEAMQPAMKSVFGNPSSMHPHGQQARAIIDLARQQVAEGFGSDPDEVFFTSGATEANNLALSGVMAALPLEKQHLITSRIEHHAVLHPAEHLARQGCKVTFLPVDRQGLVAAEDVEQALQEKPGLVSIMMINNEVGTRQDIQAFTRLAHAYDSLIHTDAVQAVGCFSVDTNELEIDLMSISAHKIYGPKGVGALYVRKGTPIAPILFGGAQEGRRRPGTENVAGIAGLGAAMALRNADYMNHHRHCLKMRHLLVSGLKQFGPEVQFNGSESNGAPQIISVSFPDVDAELLLFRLSQMGAAVSMGSACTSESIEPSHVLTSMGVPLEQIEGTIRISVGRATNSAAVEEFLSILEDCVGAARKQDEA